MKSSNYVYEELWNPLVLFWFLERETVQALCKISSRENTKTAFFIDQTFSDAKNRFYKREENGKSFFEVISSATKVKMILLP